jgi:hypothetical protein
MADADVPKAPSALVNITDALGLSKPATRLVEAIAAGVGEWAYPTTLKRRTAAEISAFKSWAREFRKEGIPIAAGELELGERAALRLTTQEIRKQENREAVAVQAVEEFKILPSSEIDAPQDPEWLDRFWRLAESVSSDDFQSLWGRILARQTTGASTFSARALETLSMLSRSEAELLEKLAPRTIKLDTINGPTACVLQSLCQRSYAVDYAGEHAWANCETAFAATHGNSHRDTLGPIGIMVEDGWAYEAVARTLEGVCEFGVADRRYRLSGCPAYGKVGGFYFGAGVRYSAVGSEIMELIRAKPNPAFLECMKKSFETVGINWKEVA